MGNDWNDFMQSKKVRLILNLFCTVICGYYAVSGILELVSPGDSAQILIESVGTTAYYALTVARIAVCAWVSIVFARMAFKVYKGEE